MCRKAGPPATEPQGMELDQIRIEQSLLVHAEDVERYISSHLPQRLRLRVSIEDVLQEVWADVFRNHERFPLMDPEATRRQLLNLAKFKLLDAEKQYGRLCRSGGLIGERRVHRPGSLSGMLSSLAHLQITPSKDAIRTEAERQLLERVDLLPANRRTAIRLRYIEERSIDDIANMMAVTRSAARSLVAQGLRQLRHMMAE